ncbi:protein JTB [Cylas formicarius]|uniref:protein JTB n=1 Tax=Cylas formicarius TaxID=197179 RepID=UPI00295840DC|nr:protein JTB [Cylas formicarius]
MIESCPKKRMLLGITLLGILTIVILIVESHWTDNERISSKRRSFIVEQNSTCWEKESYEVVKDCEPCTPFELRSKTLGVCIHTKYKEILKCANGDYVTRSCDRTAYYDEQSFWRFEASMFGLSAVSVICVFSRKKVLNKRMLQRVQRQLANCV